MPTGFSFRKPTWFPKDEVESLSKRLKRMNPRAPVKKIHFGNAKIDEMLDIRGFNLNAILELDPEFLTDSHHEHHDEVESFVFKSDKPFDGAKLEQFLSGMIQVYGPDLLRYKGVLWMKGKKQRVVFQGVHMMMGGDMGKPWAQGREEELDPGVHRQEAAEGPVPRRPGAMPGRMIAVRNLEHRYEGNRALSLPQWQAAAGSRWLILGPSGCGKTTLLHVLAGLIKPSAGEVSVFDTDLLSLKGAALDQWRGSKVGIVLQALHLVPHLSVRDNLRLAQYLARAPQSDAARRRRARRARRGRQGCAPAAELSQGEQQRVAIARAVVNGPKLLLADEPTASLDDAAAARAVDLLLEVAERRKATLVVATHDSRVKQRFGNTLQL